MSLSNELEVLLLKNAQNWTSRRLNNSYSKVELLFGLNLNYSPNLRLQLLYNMDNCLMSRIHT